MTQHVEQNELFDLAFRFVTETQESIFLTGKAGTGKTTFLKFLKSQCSKNSIIAAPTGVAAIHAGGVTLHSLFHLPLHPFLPTKETRSDLLKTIRYSKQRLNLLRKMELLVIDEISMVRSDLLDAIDTILKSVRRNHEAPFGGAQMLYIGDLYQLPPVVKRDEWELLRSYYDSPFFFDSHAVKEQQPLLIELEKIYRQKEHEFVDLLNHVRNNQMTDTDYRLLNSRYQPNFEPDRNQKFITLTTHNHQADRINEHKLQQLNTDSFVFKASIDGDFPEHLFPAESDLILKEGAQVMFLKNDSMGQKYFNGKIGTVQQLERDKVVVQSEGETIEVAKDVWEHTRYTLNRTDEKLEQEVLGSFQQYPLRLAWAVTIHKSQGLTFDHVMMDAAASFSSGQVYVALSRCTRLDGIVLLTPIPPAAIQTNQHIAHVQTTLKPKGSLLERFRGARQLFTLHLLCDLFELNKITASLQELQKTINLQLPHLNETADTWTSHWTQSFVELQTTALKFSTQIQTLLAAMPLIEENEGLQQRIRDAAAYFLPRIQSLKEQLEQHPISTERKETAVTVDEALRNLLLALHDTIYLMHYGNEPFSLTGFLKHKLNAATPRISITSYATQKIQNEDPSLPNPELYHQLKSWRDQICKDQNLPIYMVANASSLKEICTYLPVSKQQLQLLSGFGKAKSEQYGDAIIDLVDAYCKAHGIESAMDHLPATTPKVKKQSKSSKQVKGASVVLTLQAYKEGKSIREIAEERKLTTGTIESHLIEFVATGEVPVDYFVPSSKLPLIRSILTAHPDKKHSEIKSMLGADYSYTEIKAAALDLQKNKAHS